MSKIINVVLSGGVGSRLWPLSRKARPKQYLPLFGGKTLFELTVERNQPLVSKVTLVGSSQNKDLAEAVLKRFDSDIIAEAAPRNTAAAIAFAAFHAEPDDILIVTPSDHLIEGEEDYQEAINQGIVFAQEGYIATFGIIPTRPETGYGYIEHEGNTVLAFREKPNELTAREFLKRGSFLWNSGIFCFKAGVFLEELMRFEPKLYAAAETAFEYATDLVLDQEHSLQIPSKSIDYAVLEKSDLIKVVPAKFRWSDMGAFDSLFSYLKEKGHPVDENGNIVVGTSKHTVFVGLSNCMLINTDDAVLILDRNRSQEVKQVYELLEKGQSPLV
ncbi:NTP transferase domain-containing protein [Sphingobacterium sp. DK4209]|uniref:NTP transferase domain-containing protein n=1 Tax=Sphingobacterium zhuxiongii TaxID=2662364 RepID=A0A5Q0QEG7_9SPHI|nr:MULTISPECIES: sugar phosphate nucleotidyltransferase [unclassified Sphingobacterium]MVZ65780.1 NTP transferase domain-containing protein [Sphingobacterium sp. DK4209]QGA27976.1 NTP transferase domain-containing protein [Sphingobacterium sp. dk4302]